MPHLHVALDGSFMELTSTWTSRLRADATWARDGCYPFEWWDSDSRLALARALDCQGRHQ